MKRLLSEAIDKGFSYAEYRDLIKRKLAVNESTGTNDSEDMIKYTQLNDHRMDRLDKTAALIPEIITEKHLLKEQYTWLLITEGWCGDAANTVPVIAKAADFFPQVELKIILRDTHPEIIDLYLTNGGRSIPKLISYKKEGLKEVATWGPRPAEAQNLFTAYKALGDNKPPYSEFSKSIQLWYARDKTISTQKELLSFLEKHKTSKSELISKHD